MESETLEVVECVITLVHGTWASKADWVRPGSKLRTQLECVLPKPALIKEFGWSGRNSARAREAAARELALRLCEDLKSNPAAVHFVIGHSHGGNVALKAVELADAFDRVHVICLSTPFFYVVPRNYGGDVAIAFGMLMCLLAGWYVFVSKFLPGWSDGFGLAITSMLPMTIGILVAVYLKDWAKKIVSRFTLLVPPSASLLIIRSTGDEATLSIGAFQFAGWLLTRCVRAYLFCMVLVSGLFILLDEKLSGWLDGLPNRILNKLIGVWALCLVGGLIGMIGSANTKLQWASFVAFALSILAFFLVYAIKLSVYLVPMALGVTVGALVVPVGLILMGCALLPLGSEALVSTLLYEVTVEPVPLGSWTLSQLAIPEGDELQHSKTYDHPEALAAIKNWVCRIANRRSTDLLV